MNNIAKFETLRTESFLTITSSYTAVSTKYTDSIRVFVFVNGTDHEVYFTTIPSVDQLLVLPGQSVTFNITSNEDGNEKLRFPAGTQIYVRSPGAAVTSGAVYVMALSNNNNN